MATPRIAREDAETLINLLNEILKQGFKLRGTPSAISEVARRIGTVPPTIYSRLRAAERWHGLIPDKEQKSEFVVEPVKRPEDYIELILTELRRGARKTLAQLSSSTGCDIGQVLDGIDEIRKRGTNIHRVGDTFEIPSQAEQAFVKGPTYELLSKPDNTFTFGAAGDLHAASKYTRWDVREDLYRQFAERGVQCVFDTGNWIDGECNFNRYDIEAHGIDAQCRLLAARHPNVPSVETLAVWGDDHEGWYVTRDGIDVGRYCEAIMREHGHPWTNLGFMEAHVTLRNANTGKTATLAVVHPGGGSAYALSYSVQKIVESYEGGEKPDVALYGHYHKLWAGLIRNIWIVQTGCQQDQTPFMRKKRLEAHVGGALVDLEQDPETGAITSMTPKLMRYFNRGYYGGRWSKHGEVILPDRK